MLDFIEHWDRVVFLFINESHSTLLDSLMWNISGKLQWIPLYLILLYLLFKHYKKKSWIVFIGVAVLITLVDQSSVHLFKEMFERYRPCHNLELKPIVHLVQNKCGGKFGFVSSHAANTFALATYVGLLLAPLFGKKALILLIIWAGIVSYSRIYLGVHYPIDVIGGGLLGAFIAIVVFRIINRLVK